MGKCCRLPAVSRSKSYNMNVDCDVNTMNSREYGVKVGFVPNVVPAVIFRPRSIGECRALCPRANVGR